MRKSIKVIAGAVVLLACGASTAVADSGGSSAAVDSPGVVAGNTVHIPAHIPVNLCGNTVDVIGLLNPAFGNGCLSH
ncbi:chaplin [Streptomyces sp. 1222.5]|uniref:chaplin n=1 Tax=Streptomyces sp. 1222.5 TaxID=1881026 RepID=UPI003D752A95